MPEVSSEKLERRAFIGKVSLVAVTGALLAQGFYYLRSLIPNVLYEKPRRAKIGMPERFADGYTYVEEQNVFIVKEGKSFYAMSAICTHLGCTVKSVALNQPRVVELDGHKMEIRQEFHCPCHGSRFYGDGRNYAGPAPRPLERFKLTQAPEDGQLIIDMREIVGAEYRLTLA